MTDTRVQCPKCAEKGNDNSKDNLVVYPDNSKHCFSCGYNEGNPNAKPKTPPTPLLAGSHVELASRGLTLKTCQMYNIRVKDYVGKMGRHEFNEKCVIFPYYDNGKVVKQKIRSLEDKKKMTQVGETKHKALFGKHLFSPTKKLSLVITEGEFDAPAVWQATGLPSVSIARGAGSAKADLLEDMEWLMQWKDVILCFDDDEQGIKATNDCVEIFEPGFVKVANLPLKDANEMVMAGRSDELKNCIVRSETRKLSTIVSLLDIREEILKQPQHGSPWPWKFLNSITYGCRLGETYMMAGPEGCGKTQFMYEVVGHHLNNGCKVGFFDLERSNSQSTQRFLGAMHNKCFHKPGSKDWDPETIDKELHRLNDSIKLYRPESGKLSLESVLINMRYMNKCFGITFFIIDNLSKLYSPVAGIKPYEFAEIVTSEICKIDTELNVTTFIINHLGKAPVQLAADITMGDNFEYKTNLPGLSWATGRMAEPEQIYGGKNVTALPDYVFIFARNRMATDDHDRRTLMVKAVKTRFDSDHEGHVQKLLYDPHNSGKYKEIF